MGKGLLLYILVLFVTVNAHAKTQVTINDIECIQAASSGPNGEFTHRQITLILQSIQNYWKREFAARGAQFEGIRYAVFDGAVQTACGSAVRDSGPFYCFADHTVYVDPAWFRVARQSLGQETQTLLTFVLAHEVGHHIQQQLDVVGRMERLMQMKFGYGYTSRIDLGPPMEYQADCLAAVYLSTLHEMKILKDHDIHESVARMLMLGDDAAEIRRQMQMQHRPGNQMRLGLREGYSHGTSENRQKWFINGFNGGKLEICEPFIFPSFR